MNIGQCDFDMFEVTIAKLYEAYTIAYIGGWIESLCADQPTPTQVQDAWTAYRKALVYSPVVAAPILSYEARGQLAALVAIKRAELKLGCTYECALEIHRALATAVIVQYGVSDTALMTIRLLHAVLVGPEEYLRMHKHYPVNEQAFCMAYATNAIDAVMREY